MPTALDFTFDKEFSVTLQGYDVKIFPSDQGPDQLWVEIFENGSNVFENDIPVPTLGETEPLEDLVPNVAQAAIDIFEAQRGTLGEGAGAMEAKNAFANYSDESNEEWFMSFKGTPYEDMAYNILKQLLEAQHEIQSQKDPMIDRLYSEYNEVEYQLDLINLERMKSCSANTKIIIVQAKQLTRNACYMDTKKVQEFLDKFVASPYEPEVINLVNKILDIKEQIILHEKTLDESYTKIDDIRKQMDSLSVEALQANVLEKIPQEGIGAYPNMAGDIAELMEGVSMDEPLEPTLPSFFAAKKKSDVIEKGKDNNGLDYAEVDGSKFCKGDKITVKTKFESSTPGGVGLVIPKGSKGIIENCFDGSGNDFVVYLEDFGSVILPVEFLS